MSYIGLYRLRPSLILLYIVPIPCEGLNIDPIQKLIGQASVGYCPPLTFYIVLGVLEQTNQCCITSADLGA
jgi:hypothetical protein